VKIWDWNQSILRKKMTAFLYEGLVKIHLTWVRMEIVKQDPI